MFDRATHKSKKPKGSIIFSCIAIWILRMVKRFDRQDLAFKIHSESGNSKFEANIAHYLVNKPNKPTIVAI